MPARQSRSDGKQSRLEHWESFWQEKQHVDEVYSNADRIVRNLLAVTPRNGKEVLEMEAGTGRDSLQLVRHRAEVVQIDYSHQSLTILRKLAEQQRIQARIVWGDAFRLPFRGRTLNIVFHQELLKHFREPQAEALLRQNINVLRKCEYILATPLPQFTDIRIGVIAQK